MSQPQKQSETQNQGGDENQNAPADELPIAEANDEISPFADRLIQKIKKIRKAPLS